MAKNKVKFEGALAEDTRKILNNNFRDVSVSTAVLTANANTTLANVAGMVTDELEPGNYTFRIFLPVDTNASAGIKIALKQSVASMLTSIEYDAQGFAASAVAASRGTTATDAASIFAATAAYVNVVVFGYVTVAKRGTLQLQAAQNASNASNTTVPVGAWMEFTRVTTG